MVRFSEKHVYTLIPWLGNGATDRHSSSWMTRIGLSFIVDTIAADVLATQGAGASAKHSLTSMITYYECMLLPILVLGETITHLLIETAFKQLKRLEQLGTADGDSINWS